MFSSTKPWGLVAGMGSVLFNKYLDKQIHYESTHGVCRIKYMRYFVHKKYKTITPWKPCGALILFDVHDSIIILSSLYYHYAFYTLSKVNLHDLFSQHYAL